MTRKEEIKEMAEITASHITSDKDMQVAFADALRRGAQWADAHPANADIIDKVCRWLERELKEYIDVPIYSGSANIYMDALLEDLRNYADSHPHWISVEDELPPILENVLVCRKGNEVRVAWLSNTNWHSIDGYPLNNNITHWMPIPQPPKP